MGKVVLRRLWQALPFGLVVFVASSWSADATMGARLCVALAVPGFILSGAHWRDVQDRVASMNLRETFRAGGIGRVWPVLRDLSSSVGACAFWFAAGAITLIVMLRLP